MSFIAFYSEQTLDPKNETQMATIRNLIDSSGAAHNTLERGDKGNYKPVSLPMPKGCVAWFCSVSPMKEDGSQLLNRLMLGNPDESEEQDIRVFEKTIDDKWRRKNTTNEGLLEWCQELNELILDEGKLPVLIPYADWLVFPDKRNRRDPTKLTSIIWAITRMRCNQRKSVDVVGDGQSIEHLIAEPEDVELGLFQFNAMSTNTKNQVSNSAIRILELVPEKESEAISKKELSTLTKKGQDWCYRCLTELLGAGLVNYEKRDRAHYYWRLNAVSARNVSDNRVEWDKITLDGLKAAFDGLSVSRSEKAQQTILEYIQRFPSFPKSTPGWLKELKPPNQDQKQELNSDNRDKPSSTEPESSTEKKLMVESEFV